MGLATLPLKTDGSIGRVKSDDPAIPLRSLNTQAPAAEYEAIKSFLIDVCNEVGLHDGSTVGSLVARMVAVEDAADDAQADATAALAAAAAAQSTANGAQTDATSALSDIAAIEAGSAGATNAGKILTKTIPALPSGKKVLLYDSGGGVLSWAAQDAVSLQTVALDPTTIGSPTTGDVVTFDGTKYVAQAPSGGGSSLLWKWNETDVTQFQISYDDLGVGTVLSCETPARGPRLRVKFPVRVDGDFHAFVTVHGLTIPRDGSGHFRYVWEFDVLAFSDGGVHQADWYCLGPAVLCSDTTSNSFGLGLGAQIGGATRFCKLQAGAVTNNGDTPPWQQFNDWSTDALDHPHHFRVEVVGVKQAGAQPYFLIEAFSEEPGAGSTARMLHLGQTDTYWDSGMTAFGTAWNAVDPVTVGIVIRGQTQFATHTNQFFEFSNLRVSKHPMDL